MRHTLSDVKSERGEAIGFKVDFLVIWDLADVTRILSVGC